MSPAAPLEETELLHPRGEELDLLTITDVITLLHAEDMVAVSAVGQVLQAVSTAAEAACHALRRGGRLLYVGAGTSGRLAVVDAAECPPTFGTPPEQVVAVMAGGPEAFPKAVEGAEDDALAGENQLQALQLNPIDIVVGISASGQAPFVLGALAYARKIGARTVLVACNSKALESQAADILIVPQTGAELLSGSTRLKAGTATKLILNAISTSAMVALGKVYRGRMVDLRPSNKKLKARALRMVMELAEIPSSEAQKLLDEADGSPKIALAMHWTGLSKEQAAQLVQTQTLRQLSKSGKP